MRSDVDDNKLKKLQDIGYTIQKCCANCAESEVGGVAQWGTCNVVGYFHNKHGETRALSINATGVCPQHRWREALVLGAFDQFVKR
jgi:hypothetical protein